MVIGQSGRPGLSAHEAVRAESPIERGSATTPGRDLHNNSPQQTSTTVHVKVYD